MIVFDASTLVGAAMRADGPEALAFDHALANDRVAVSEQVLEELFDVLYRPKLARFIDVDLRLSIISALSTFGVWFGPVETVRDCRDAKDNKYLELALAAAAAVIVSSDGDLLVLDPWRGRRVLTPALYLAGVEAGGGAAATR